MRKLLFLFIAVIGVSNSYSQHIYKSSASQISFFAGTPIEDINAVSDKATSFLDTQKGEVVVSIPMTSFQFRESLMQEHFNENYVESTKYPKGEFKGKVNDLKSINWTSADTIRFTAIGSFTIHGVAKPKQIEVRLINQNGKLWVSSNFKIALADHNIDRPKILWEKLADEVEVKVKITYEPYTPVANH